MRHSLSTIAFVALAASAGSTFASSIEVVHDGAARQPSIITVSCSHCPPLIERKRKGSYTVPSLTQGSEAAEVIEAGGTRKLKRIDNLMGGSPVVFISSAEGWATDGHSIIASTTGAPNTIDTSTTTAAVVNGNEGSKAAAPASLQGNLK